MVRFSLHLAGFIGLKDFALALLQHRSQIVEARPEAANLAGVDVNGAGQLLFGQPARIAVMQQMLEGGDTISGGGAVGLGNSVGSNF